jgi:hypothetical protein
MRLEGGIKMTFEMMKIKRELESDALKPVSKSANNMLVIALKAESMGELEKAETYLNKAIKAE